MRTAQSMQSDQPSVTMSVCFTNDLKKNFQKLSKNNSTYYT